MKKLMRKAITVLGSAALIGMTLGSAMAASYPSPFTSNTAIVVGANAAPSDNIAASNVASNLDASAVGGSSTTLVGASGVTEDEVVLGSAINATTYKIETTMTDSKIPSLLDQKISWDDGNGADDYDVHEEIVINGNMTVLTSWNDEDLDGVALSNEAALEYRYVFDDALNASGVGDADADDLYLTILGKSYEVTALTNTSITVVTSEEMSVGIGESVTVQGKTFTVDDLSTTSARVNGVVVTIDGSSKKIDGLQVEASDVFYNNNFPEQASVTLKIGDDISKTYTNGDEYIGEDEDDPLWVWTISNAAAPESTTGYIGVKYNANINDADDDEAGDTIKYVGAGYVMPENFAEVKLNGLTDVDYESLTVEFADVDLYNSSDSGVAVTEDAKVIVISADSTSSLTVGGEETDKIYVYYAANNSETEASYNYSEYGSLEVFYRDHDGDFTPTNKARFEKSINLTTSTNLATGTIATLEVGDTTMTINATIASGDMTLRIINPDDDEVKLNISGTVIADDAGTLERLGATVEDADANDIIVSGVDVSTKDAAIMDNYGVIVAEDDSNGVEGNADDDKVILSIPSDQVYATVSVVAGGEASTSTEAGVMTVSDANVASVAGKNLVVVGGSAINSVAAELLGGAYSEGAFTSATGVAAGEFLIQSFTRSGKTALLVAGYTAADTEKAVTYLLNNDVDTTVGKKYKGTSGTEASLVVV